MVFAVVVVGVCFADAGEPLVLHGTSIATIIASLC